MSDIEIRGRLNSLKIVDFVRVQRENGRQGLPPEVRDSWSEQNKIAIEILRDPPRGEIVRRLAGLLDVITRSVAVLAKEARPRYYAYTDVHVLDWYLGRQRETFATLRGRALKGICVLLRDLVRFEAETIAGMEARSALSLNRECIEKRIEAVRAAFEEAKKLIPPERKADPQWLEEPTNYHTLEEYAMEPSRVSALVHFSCMPQTKFHDEVVFLRSIHIAEFCFYAIRLSLIEAIENTRDPIVQSQALQEAVAYSTILHLCFKVLRTMPVEHFKDFRGSTGDASAVQSRNYQLMEIHLRGLNPSKSNQFSKDPLLRDLTRFSHPEFVNLGSVMKQRESWEGRWASVLDAARTLDKKLLSWRGLHLGFAKVYLEPDQGGTGATVGAAYLERVLRLGLFDDSEIDIAIIEDVFADFPEIPEMFRRVPANTGIAPTHVAI